MLSKKYLHRICSLLMAVLLMVSLCACASGDDKGLFDSLNKRKGIRFSATVTQSDIDKILTTMDTMDALCKSAPQQSQNGADACYDMVKLIATGLGVSASEISEIQLKKSNLSQSANSAVQEQVNSTYRTAELLFLIAKKLDKDNTYNNEIVLIESTFTLRNSTANSAPKQMVNGLYRTVEILEVIAKIADKDKDYTSDIDQIMTRFSTQDNLASSAPQQEVNGAYRSVEMILLIAEILDYDSDFSSEISTIDTRLTTQNNLANSAPQQNANGVYRMAEAFGLLAEVLNS